MLDFYMKKGITFRKSHSAVGGGFFSSIFEWTHVADIITAVWKSCSLRSCSGHILTLMHVLSGAFIH